MNYRRGLHRLALSVLIAWELVMIAGVGWHLWLWRNDPYRDIGSYLHYYDDERFVALMWALAAFIGPAVYLAGRWIAKGFKPI